MTFDVHPVTPDRVDDFVAVVNPNRRVTHCWCLSHRLTAGEIAELGHGSRETAFRALCARPNPAGVIGYDDGEPVGWCSIGPRSENTRLGRSRLIRPLDDVAVWSWSMPASGGRSRWRTAPRDAAAYAHALYAMLRELDAMGAREIWIERSPGGGEWAGTDDRLRRAAS